jgi:DNA ligase-1
VIVYSSLTQISGRLEKENIFCQLFTAVAISTPEDLEIIVYLASNKIAPAYETGMELG